LERINLSFADKMMYFLIYLTFDIYLLEDE